MIFAEGVIEQYEMVKTIDNLLSESYVEENIITDKIKQIKEDYKEFERIRKEVISNHKKDIDKAKVMALITLGLGIIGNIIIHAGAPLIGLAITISGFIPAIISNNLTKVANAELEFKRLEYKKKIKSLRAKNKNDKLDKNLEKIEKAL